MGSNAPILNFGIFFYNKVLENFIIITPIENPTKKKLQ